MFIQLDFESEIPIYEQLKNELIIGIAKKQLVPGERLPSVRRLASDIGINLHTVNKAYQQLQQEGFLLIHRQKGVVVNPDGPPIASQQDKQNLLETFKPLIARALCRRVTSDEIENIVNSIIHEIREGDENGF